MCLSVVAPAALISFSRFFSWGSVDRMWLAQPRLSLASAHRSSMLLLGWTRASEAVGNM